MSFIDLEYDILQLSSSPLIMNNYFPKYYYCLYNSMNDDKIIINGSFILNFKNDLYKTSIDSNPYYSNLDKIFVYTNKFNFYINIDKLEIENNNSNQHDYIYLSDIKINKNIKYRDIVILLSNPIIINISIDTKLASNQVSIAHIKNYNNGGSKKIYFNQQHKTKYEYIYNNLQDNQIYELDKI